MSWIDDPEERREVVELYEALGTIRAVQKVIKRGQEGIAEALRREGVALRAGHRFKLDAGDRREIAKMYRDGWNSHDIAEVYGVHHNTILRALRNEGVEVRTPGRYMEAPQGPRKNRPAQR